MTIVSDASPLINLAAIGNLPLLNQVVGNVLIPNQVYQEIVIDGVGKVGSTEVGAAKWINTYPVKNKRLVVSLRQYLDAGEAQAIALALEMNIDSLLIDERRGRQIAESFGLNTIGVLGIFIQAKHQGYIENVKELLDELITTAHFRLSSHLYHRVLKLVNEN